MGRAQGFDLWSVIFKSVPCKTKSVIGRAAFNCSLSSSCNSKPPFMHIHTRMLRYLLCYSISYILSM
uniref:Uncharacterized protein n=1 Tax=Magnetococcus massalia (strain MO-1) TaxID=451514 RepID=A0A1S7LMN9_MAGMO|nr:protein of unknown function [Candidatus Magnetococcus massalia]